MLVKIHEFRRRVDSDMDSLVDDLQHLTHRFGFAEEQAWRSSLPRLSVAFSYPSFAELDLYFGGEGNLSLEYRLPACGSWADMVLLGSHGEKPAAVIVELKDWATQGDLPGPGEGLMQRPGRVDQHPSYQVQGYVEWCRRFHSAVQGNGAKVHGCVVFTKDPYYASYTLKPNEGLTQAYPCFSVDPTDVASRLPAFFRNRLTAPDREFAESFEKGFYTQARGFVQMIGRQILDPEASPFVLLDNQRRAFALVRARVDRAVATGRTRPVKTVILVEGPPGSGKSVVAAQTWASLVTHPKLPGGNVVITTTSASQNSNWKYLFDRVGRAQGGSGAVLGAVAYTPLSTSEFGKLRYKYPDAFKAEVDWRENLKMLRSLQPEFRSGSKDVEHLVSIVDEAHALINPEHVEGRGQFGFTGAMGPQAYHIMRASLISVFFLDPQQGFRDRENTTVADIKKWAKELGAEVIDEISLGDSQFRCAGSIEYVEAIQSLLKLPKREDESIDAEMISAASSGGASPARFAPFDLRIGADLGKLEELLRDRRREGFSVRYLASYARKWKTEKVALPHQGPDHLKDFNETYLRDGRTLTWSKIWNYVPKGSDYTHFVQAPQGSKMFEDPLCEVGCPYAVRGFDFDYVGLLWLSDLKWREDRWIADPDHIYERGINRLKKSARDESDPVGPHHLALIRALKEAYRIILTRPMKGLYLWCEDEETKQHLISVLSVVESG